VSALGRKRRRDLYRLKGQVATIAIVLACGFMAMIMMRSTFRSLIDARDDYYAAERFGDVFAQLTRAPARVADELLAIPGIAQVYPRVAEDVMVALPGAGDPITGRVISIPDGRPPPLGGIHLRAGRLPEAASATECVILERFAELRRIAIGDEVPVVIAGRLHRLRVVGTAMSPEYVLAAAGGAMADPAGFVVLWMSHAAASAMLGLDGAFDDVVIRLEPGARPEVVLPRIDAVLAPWGGRHAVARDHQPSNLALTAELDNLRKLAVVIPAIFLAVAAFLVNVVVSRLVLLERPQIAVLKALGYRDGAIALHYLGLVALVVAIAAVLGVGFGVWAGRWMTGIYADFYRFPTRLYRVEPDLVITTLAIGLGAAIAGALVAVRRVVRLPAAEAMRPAVPLRYRRTLLERLGFGRLVGPSAMIVVRELTRRPLRLLLSTSGIAMGVAIFMFGKFSWDSFDHLFDDTFQREHRETVAVTLAHTAPARAAAELAAMPGVLVAEPVRDVVVRFRAGARWRDGVIQGEPAPARLHVLLDGGTTPVTLPEHGIVVTRKLAEVLGVAPGDRIDVEVLEGEFPTLSAPIAGVVDEPFGLLGHARLDWLDRWLGGEPRVTGVRLALDPDAAAAVRARLKSIGSVISVAAPAQVIERYRAQTGSSMLTITLILAVSAAAIAVGVIYNNARVALSQRGRDLASLRVLGFTRREISSILLGELAIQLAIGIPLGLCVGRWGTEAYARSVSDELMRFPFYLSPRTYVAAAAIALAAGVISALFVRRKLDRLDLVEVLKAAE
jgi:putative ABC transport system permease protein